MNTNAILPEVNNEVNNSNTTNTMNNFIDFSKVYGKDSVAKTATVDTQVVKDIFNAFMAIPQAVTVRFKNEDGFLKMIVKMNLHNKFTNNYETYADGKLIEYMLNAMVCGQIGSLEGYSQEEHPISASEVDPRIDIFSQFLHSPFRCQFDADLITKKGDRYVCATFRIGYKKEFKFYLKRTEEIENMITEVLKAA